MIYNIYSIPYEMRGSKYLDLLKKSIEDGIQKDTVFKVKRFSWKELLFVARAPSERRLVQIHWETNIYGSEYALVSLIRMAYRFPGLLLLKLRGVKIVWTIHNLSAHDYPHPWIDSMGRSLMWHIVDAVTIQQKRFAEIKKKERKGQKSPHIYYIPHPNFVGVFGPPWTGDRKKLRTKHGISPTSIVLLAFGSVRPYKELPTLIDAVTVARGKGADVVLLIAGKATEEYGQEILKKSYGNPAVIARLGFVNDAEVPEFMALSDYSALYYSDSSLNSGPLLVSLSYGIPVITRDMPASEIIVSGTNGLVFHDERELIKILLNLSTVHISGRDDIIRTSGPDWLTMAVELRRAYVELWQDRP